MPDKKKIKENLEHERDILLEQLKDMGKLDAETGEWEATPEQLEFPESDENDKADRFEDFEKFNDENPGTASEQYFKGLKEVE